MGFLRPGQSLEGLEPGTYYLVLDGNTGRHIDFEVAHTAAVQAINVLCGPCPASDPDPDCGAAAAIVALLVRWKKNHPGPHLLASAALRAAAAKAKALRTAGEAASEGQGPKRPPSAPQALPPTPKRAAKRAKSGACPSASETKR